jgi:MFS family permease
MSKEKKRFVNPITINIYWFALSLRSNVLTPLLLPLLVQRFVGDADKGASYGSLRLYSLMVALVVQAIMGLLSDRSTSRFGRRRPFILGGTLLDIVLLLLIGLIGATMSGQQGFTALFIVVVISGISINIAHAATQGLIPDLVPEAQRGRYSGVKALFEVPLPLIVTPFLIMPMIRAGNYMGAIFMLIAVMLIAALLTMLVREVPQKTPPFPMDWSAIGRLALMTLAFTGIIVALGEGIKRLIPLLNDGKSFLVLGLLGLAAMLIAIFGGVSASIKIGLGSDATLHPSYRWWVINRLAFLVGAVNLSGFVLYFIQERFPQLRGDAAAGPTSQLMMMVGLALLVSSLPAGWLSDRLGTKRLLLISGLLTTAGGFLVLLAPSIPVLLAGGIIVGLGIGSFYPANWSLGTRLVPKEQAGRYLGLSNLAGAGAGAIGAYIGGPIGDKAGFSVLMAIYASLFIFSTLALTKIQAPWGPQQVALSDEAKNEA